MTVKMVEALERELNYVKARQDGAVREAEGLLKGSRTHLAHNLSARAVAIAEAQAQIELLEALLRDERMKEADRIAALIASDSKETK